MNLCISIKILLKKTVYLLSYFSRLELLTEIAIENMKPQHLSDLSSKEKTNVQKNINAN